MNQETFLAFVPPVALALGGWILSVERRLGKMEAIDGKLDILVEYLIPDRERPDKGRGSEGEAV